MELHRDLVEYLRTVWQNPDSGIWEERRKPRQFVYSNAMAWVALDRAVKKFEQHSGKGPVKEWRILRQHIHDEVCRNGFNHKLNSFVAHYG